MEKVAQDLEKYGPYSSSARNQLLRVTRRCNGFNGCFEQINSTVGTIADQDDYRGPMYSEEDN